MTVPHAGGVRHLLVEAPEGATLGAVHQRLGLPGPDEVGDAGAPVLHGAALPTGRSPDGGSAGPRLVVAAGPGAGASVTLRPGRSVVVGRSPGCDLTIPDPGLSRHHLRVSHERAGVVVEDLGSTNGVQWEGAGPEPAGPPAADAGVGRSLWPADTAVVIGDTRLELASGSPPPTPTRSHGGQLLITPWPRHVPPVEPALLTTPPAPVRRITHPPSAWTWALPLVACLALAIVMRMPMMLAFGLLAPAMVLGQHLGDRRASRRDFEQATRAHAQARVALAHEAHLALSRELQVLRERAPGPRGVVTSLVPHPALGLWSSVGEALTVVIGQGRVRSEVVVDGAALDHANAPVTLDLDQPIAITGLSEVTEGAARGWLLQLATAHPPSELAIEIDPALTTNGAWDLLAWLPHTRLEPSPVVRRIRLTCWSQHGLLLVPEGHEAAEGTAVVVRLDDHGGRVQRPGRPDEPFAPDLVGLPLARRLARALAGLDHAPTDQSEHPQTLGDLRPWPTTEAEVRAGWAAPSGMRTPLGVDDAGATVEVDLVTDGPHALIAGTTGSGKSELLRTLVTGLALAQPPSRLALLLLDYKGGSALAECASLPHSAGLVTDLDPHLAQRVLSSLAAELRRREAVLAAAGARDVSEYRGADLPRLLVVVDEFRVLAEELPDFLGGLIRLAAVGRSLGVHLVLATQRPAGVVSADLRSNVNLRIALRVRDPGDSLDVLEVPDAARLPEGRPGLALLRTGVRAPRRVQVVPATARQAPTRDQATAWRITEVEDAWAGRRLLDAPATDAPHSSELGDLPDLMRLVATADGERAPQVWLPPLDARILAPRGPSAAWAVADRPEIQSREEVTWDGRHHVAIVGAGRSGRSTAAEALVRAIGQAWLYVVDPARALESSPIARHPGLRAWVGPGDPGHALRVLEVLDAEIDRRLGSPATTHSPVVLVVDGWDRFLEAYGDLRQGRARDLALRVLRDGPAVGVHAVLTGDRSLLLGAVASEMPETWALRLNDPSDLALTGLRPHQVPADPPPGRLVRTRDGVVAHVLLRPTTDETTDEDARARAPSGPAPPAVTSLPTTLTEASSWAVGGDDAGPMPAPPGSFLVLGPPGSGVSTALSGLASAITDAVGEDERVVHVDATDLADDASALEVRLPAGAGLVVVDDAHLLAGSRHEDALLAYAARSGARLLVGAELEAGGSLYRGLVPHVGARRHGLILQPSSAAHGMALGASLPICDRRVPGRGILVERGHCTRVQVAAPEVSTPGADTVTVRP